MTVFGLEGQEPDLKPPGECWIAPNASLIGDVTLGSQSSIWFGSVLRGDREPIAIGAGSNIQDLGVLHTDPRFPLTVGENCTIGHRVILHGCTIGDNTLIGMGAVVLNGAKIGRNCIIGAAALITEGKEIPDGSLVIGLPGRVARDVSESEIAENKRSAANYVDNWKRYVSGLTLS